MLEPRSYFSNLSTNINFLAIKFFRFRMFPTLNYLTDSDVDSCKVFHCCFTVLFFLFLILLFILFFLFFFFPFLLLFLFFPLFFCLLLGFLNFSFCFDLGFLRFILLIMFFFFLFFRNYFLDLFSGWDFNRFLFLCIYFLNIWLQIDRSLSCNCFFFADLSTSISFKFFN